MFSGGATSSSRCSSKSTYVYLLLCSACGKLTIVGLTVVLLCDQADPKTGKPMPAHPDTLWEVEVKTANPVRNTQETPISRAVDAVLEVQLLMRGLLDLRRKDV